MSDEYKPLWKRVNWNNEVDDREEECGERSPLIRESTAIQVDNDADKITPVVKQSPIHENLDKAVGEAHNTIGKLLLRGDDLDDMRQKAETLEDSSKLFKKTTREQKDKVWWDHLNKSIWAYAFATLCALGGLLLLIMIIESLIKMFSRPTVPIAKPPITGPPPAAPAPGPQPAPGNPGSGFPAFTCNCYCPPVYYPAPPQQTPRAFQQSEVPWGVYPEQTFSDIDRDAEVAPFDGTETQLNQGMVPHEEIPDA